MNYIGMIAGLAFLFGTAAAHAEVQDCVEIVSVPAVITQQGIHCLKQDLSYGSTTGNAIDIQTNSVIIELNGYKLGGLAGGSGTNARGIHALNRLNITIRNGTIRGFNRNVMLEGAGNPAATSGHLIENMRFDTGRTVSVEVHGSNSVIRNNIFTVVTGVSATGLKVVNGSGISIAGNIISDVGGSDNATGIKLSSVSTSSIQGNEIRNTVGGLTADGIDVGGGDRVYIKGNLIVNAVIGSFGIDAGGTADACFDNDIGNYSIPLSGCSTSNSNRTF